MLAACLGGRGDSQQPLAIPAGQGQRLHDAGLTLGKSSCLVEYHGGEPIHPLEGRGIANEQPGSGARPVATATAIGVARPKRTGKR